MISNPYSSSTAPSGAITAIDVPSLFSSDGELRNVVIADRAPVTRDPTPNMGSQVRTPSVAGDNSATGNVAAIVHSTYRIYCSKNRLSLYHHQFSRTLR